MVPKILFWVVFAVFASALAFPKDDVSDSPPQPPGPLPPKSTTTPATTSSTTTTSTTTTPTTTTPTTTTPTTTTPATTTQTTTSTSTPPTTPPSTTTAVPITTPKPTPTPKPDVGKWNVTNNKDNITCILAEMAIQLNVTYVTKDNKTQYGILDVPKNASVTGSCGNDSQVFNLTWPNKDNTSNVLNIVFKKNSTNNRFMIGNISSSVNPSDEFFPNIKVKNVINLYNNETEFSTPLDKSYRCAKEQSFGLLQDKTNKTGGTIVLSHVQIEAFHQKTDDSFGAAEDCEGGSSPDIVPIAVGCALVGLVAIVLIAYLVGRRRSQARGYLSM